MVIKTTVNVSSGANMNTPFFEELSSERRLIIEEAGQLLTCKPIKERTIFSSGNERSLREQVLMNSLCLLTLFLPRTSYASK